MLGTYRILTVCVELVFRHAREHTKLQGDEVFAWSTKDIQRTNLKLKDGEAVD